MSRLRPLRLVAALLALMALVAGCSSSEPSAVIVSGDDPSTSAKNIIETLEADGGYVILLELLEHAGLTELLEDPDAELTLFAPTDTAFASLGEGVEATLMGDTDVIIVPVDEPGVATDTEATDEVEEEGEDVNEDAAEEAGDEEAVDEDADGAIVPAAPLSSLQTSELLTAILGYHVVDGVYLTGDLAEVDILTTAEGSDLDIGTREEPAITDDGEPTTVITVNDADITTENLLASNGVIQAIDSVLIPEDHAADMAQLLGSIPVATDVMSTLRATGQHGELVAAIEAAGLEGDLADAGAITIFAPTDAAFAALTDEQRAALADPEVLRQVLLFHAVGRTVTQADVLNRESVASLEGERLLIVKDGEVYTVDDVTIDREIPATNGAVQVIDTILVPESAQGPGGL